MSSYLLFELAGVDELLDDVGVGSEAVLDEYDGTLYGLLRGSFALGGGAPGLPIPCLLNRLN